MTGNADDGWIVLDGPLKLGFQRTLRVPERGGPFPLPPALGRVDVWPVSALKSATVADADVVVPLHVHEAIWLQFRGRSQEPRAVKLGVGGVDALTGEAWTVRLQAAPQNYVVCPYQPWLDGFNTGDGIVRQFVAVPLHSGQSVEHQLTGADIGGITVACYRPVSALPAASAASTPRDRNLGVGAGGRIRQRIYRDPYGIEIWQGEPVTVTRVRLMEAEAFTRQFGVDVAPSPVDAATYTRFGLPWFEIHDESRSAVDAPPALSGLKPVPPGDAKPDVDASDNAIDPPTIKRIPPRSRRPRPD